MKIIPRQFAKSISILIVISVFYPANLFAQSQKAINAMDCSALYWVSSYAFGANRKVAALFEGLQKTFQGIYDANEVRRLDHIVPEKIILKAKSEAAIRLGQLYGKNPKAVYSIEMSCNAWRAIISTYFANKPNTSDGQRMITVLSSVPPLPPTPQSNDLRWPKSKALVDRSFLIWSQMGRGTPESTQQKQ
jgi:hypothetical protein